MITVRKVICDNRSCSVCMAQNYESAICDKENTEDIFELHIDRICVALCKKCLIAVKDGIEELLNDMEGEK